MATKVQIWSCYDDMTVREREMKPFSLKFQAVCWKLSSSIFEVRYQIDILKDSHV